MSATAPTVAETGEPLCVVVQAAHDAGRSVGIAAGILIGAASQAENALSSLRSSIGLLEQAAREGASPATVAAYAARLEREHAALLGQLVKLRVDAATSSTREAA